jgi:small nuclear ribonucleoprotein (snRNP)-like protein
MFKTAIVSHDIFGCRFLIVPNNQEFISFDQFSNMILQDAVERRFVHSSSNSNNNNTASGVTYYADIPLGVYVIRGDSVVLLGTIHDDMPNDPTRMKSVTLEELGELQQSPAASDTKVEAASNPDQGPLTWDFDTDLIA